jgi:hypothetical protein
MEKIIEMIGAIRANPRVTATTSSIITCHPSLLPRCRIKNCQSTHRIISVSTVAQRSPETPKD